MGFPRIKVSVLNRLPWDYATTWFRPKPGGGTVLDLGDGSTATVVGVLDESWRCTAIPDFFLVWVSIIVCGPAAALAPTELRKLMGPGMQVELSTQRVNVQRATEQLPDGWDIGTVFTVAYNVDVELPPVLEASQHTCGAEPAHPCTVPWHKSPCTVEGVRP